MSADDQCVIQSADIVLIVDSSGSVGEDGWSKVTNIMLSLASLIIYNHITRK